MEFDTNLDYLTCTWRCKNEWREAVGKLHQCVMFGNKQTHWHFLGYHGWTVRGEDGHLSYGEGRNGGIIQSSGIVANTIAKWRKSWMTPQARITRLDLALTFTYFATREIVRRLWLVPREDWRVILPAPGKGGGTLYVGARQSDRFGRLYDKGAELNRDLPEEDRIAPATLWRAEVEYKGRAALQAWMDYNVLSTATAARSWVADSVISWFSSRGVHLGIEPGSKSIVTVATRGVDDIRTISWLYEQVRPALYKLQEKGKLGEAFDALGVDFDLCTVKAFNHIGDGALQFDFFDKFAGPV